MKIKITNGQNLIRIISNNKVDCFVFMKPISVCWYDGKGSLAKYLCLLPHSKNLRKEVQINVNEALNFNFQLSETDISVILDPLFLLFQNGDYELSILHSDSEYALKYFSRFELLFGNMVVQSNENEERESFYFYKLKYNEKNNKYPSVSILDFSTFGFYCDNYFISTQHEDCINIDRVKYYENIISNGERPAALILCSTFEVKTQGESLYKESINSDYFVIDGHHKLLAYRNLRIPPTIVLLEYIAYYNSEDVEINLRILKEYLYSWQYDHLIKEE